MNNLKILEKADPLIKKDIDDLKKKSRSFNKKRY